MGSEMCIRDRKVLLCCFRFVPCLKYIIQNATSTELRLLRGKTIECISLIGLAVGKDKFLADAGEVMDLLLKTQKGESGELADDDPQVQIWPRDTYGLEKA